MDKTPTKGRGFYPRPRTGSDTPIGQRMTLAICFYPRPRTGSDRPPSNALSLLLKFPSLRE